MAFLAVPILALSLHVFDEPHAGVFPCAEQGTLDALSTGGVPHTFACPGAGPGFAA